MSRSHSRHNSPYCLPPPPPSCYLPTAVTHTSLPPPPATQLLSAHSAACETVGSLGAWRERERREERVRLSQNREAGGGERDDDGSQL